MCVFLMVVCCCNCEEEGKEVGLIDGVVEVSSRCSFNRILTLVLCWAQQDAAAAQSCERRTIPLENQSVGVRERLSARSSRISPGNTRAICDPKSECFSFFRTRRKIERIICKSTHLVTLLSSLSTWNVVLSHMLSFNTTTPPGRKPCRFSCTPKTFN